MLLSTSDIFPPVRRTGSRALASDVPWIFNWRLLLALGANLLFWCAVIESYLSR